MNRKLLFFLPAFFLQTVAFSQKNLVPNGDFEEVISMPKGVSNFTLATPWNSSAQSNEPADLFHKNAKAPEVGIPQNYMGEQQPHSGDAYAGIAVLRKGMDDYREFMQVLLTQPLEKDAEYEAEMYVSLSDYSELGINSLGLFFSRKAPLLIAGGYLLVTPQVTGEPKNVISEKDGWVKISGSFKAQGGETMLTIGNFTEPKKVLTRKVKSTRNLKENIKFAYYYIDAVKVSRVGETGEPLLATTSAYFGEITPRKPITLSNIFFKTDESELLPASFPELEKLTEFLQQNPTLTIQIAGHTDNTSTAAYNQSLSEMRAGAVKNFLLTKGIGTDRIQIKGFGSSKPVATNETESGKQQNRRVEFEVID